MIQANIPMPAPQPQSTGEAAAAKQAQLDETSADFKETLDDVSANAKSVAKDAVDANQERSDLAARQEAVEEATPEPEVTHAEHENRKERVADNREASQERRVEEEVEPEAAAVPEPVLPFIQVPVATGSEGGVAASGVNPQAAQATNVMATMALEGIEEVLQAVRGGGSNMGQNTPEAAGVSFDLRPAAARSGQAMPQVSRVPISAQSPTFSAELAERVGSIRLISRAGISDQVRINLVPRDLGNLDIRLQVDSDHRVHMLVTAETEAVKDLLKSQMSQLREAMMKQGMEFGDVDIQVDVKQREDSAGAQEGLQWDGDSRFVMDGEEGGAGLAEGDDDEERVVMGKVVRSADGGMSVFI